MHDRNQTIVDSAKSIQEKLIGNVFKQSDKLTIFDIGACEGSNAVRYARMYPNSMIYAIEPLGYNAQHIKFNIDKYNVHNVVCYEICFSNKPGNAEFFVSSGAPTNDKTIDWDFGNKSSSLFPPDKSLSVFPWLKFKERIIVPTTTLDNFCLEQSIPSIHFIHMDVQGAELLVLEGGNAMLKNTYCIWLEVENVPLYKGQPLKRDVEQFFQKNNFSKLLDTVGPVSGDQFWINDDFLVKNKRWFILLIKLLNKLPSALSKKMINTLLAKN